ncbi:MAG: cation-transporting P-type ATPase [Hydrococcus sp. Prado102]|jgi:Ca2+-transporting ATPase|nr:cation-transporting P-type ATPase [Hydrococcus sp. Prado102]
MTQIDENLSKYSEATSQAIEDILNDFSVAPHQGLSLSEVERRRQQYGLNRLEQTKRRSIREIAIAQFKSPIIGLLAVAAALSFAFQEWVEGIAIIIAILFNAGIGFFTEIKAVKSMESLQKLSQTLAKVRREGRVKEIPSEEIVPGDIIVFEAGDSIPADLRLLQASQLQADESALTGESLPVDKTTGILERDLPLAEQTNMLFKGTAITRGSGEAIAIATGMSTELGHISALTASAKEEVTPLEKRLEQLGQNLIWVVLGIAAIVAIAGFLSGRDIYLMVETAIALAVGAVPEGLPIVATVALARGMWRMAKRNAIINRLSAVEALGATSIICTDKTGTLTENRMTVTDIALESGDITVRGQGLELSGEFERENGVITSSQDKLLSSALEIAVLCNNAHLPEAGSDNFVGDPMEVALLVAGAKAGLQREELLKQYPEVNEVAFDSDTKMMATIHQTEGRYRYAIKGAPEAVLQACTHRMTVQGSQPMNDRNHWQEESERMAHDGLRILAVAEKITDNPDESPYENLALVGFVGLLDPPRLDVKDAIEDCHRAGIRVIMITGDQAITARKVGLAVGLTTDREAEAQPGRVLKSLEELSEQERLNIQQIPIFSRVSPEQKLNLIAIHQKGNAVVAMTGDGVNDAPALKKADIGIAMGLRGTQVAREAADMVLQDDAFSTIVEAIRQGRAIFENIRKFVIYLLSGNTGQIITVTVAALTDEPLPLLPLQILFLNAVNDVFPALALGVGKGSPEQMKHPPRDRREPLLTRRHWGAIAMYGVIIAAVVLGVFLFALNYWNLEANRAVTLSFLTLAFARLWHVFNMRDYDSHWLRNEVTKNRFIWLSLLLCTCLLLSAVYIPPLAQVLGVVPPDLKGWGLLLGASLIPLIVGQLFKIWRSSRRRRY